MVTLPIRRQLGCLVGVLATTAALAAGCQSTPETNAASATSKTLSMARSEASGSTRPDRVVGDRVPLGEAGGSVRVAAVETGIDAGRLFAPPRGREYVAARVEGCAGPAEHGVSFEPEYFSIRLADHTVFEGAAGAKKPALAGGAIPAGGCLDGWVTFTVPTGRPPIAVIYDGSERVQWSVATARTHL